MAYQYVGDKLIGFSVDPKPDPKEIPFGKILYEIDMGKEYINDGMSWQPYSLPCTLVSSSIAVPIDLQFSSLAASNPLYIFDVGNQVKVTATITRPANTTAYDVGDVVGATTYSSVSTGLIAGTGFNIKAITLECDIGGTITFPAEGFRLHFYNAAPAAIADNAAFNLPSGDRAKYLGFVPISTPVALNATQWSQNTVDFRGNLGSSTSTLYFYLETLGVWTPSSGLVIKPVFHIKAA